jgi:hypothetical protein
MRPLVSPNNLMSTSVSKTFANVESVVSAKETMSCGIYRLLLPRADALLVLLPDPTQSAI